MLPGTERHPHARAVLGAALAPGGAPSHAYLFSGPAGSGKRTVARAFAAALLTEGAADPAGAAARVEHGAHPDLTWVAPASAAGILVGDVDQAVVAGAARTPFESSRRVFVIEDADELNDQAANRMLKTLEEPPSFAHLILLTSRPGEVLPTIASRCQPVRFDAPSVEQIAARLERHGVAPAAADACARLGLGDAARALALALGDGPALRAGAEAVARGALRDEIAGRPVDGAARPRAGGGRAGRRRRSSARSTTSWASRSRRTTAACAARRPSAASARRGARRRRRSIAGWRSSGCGCATSPASPTGRPSSRITPTGWARCARTRRAGRARRACARRRGSSRRRAPRCSSTPTRSSRSTRWARGWRGRCAAEPTPPSVLRMTQSTSFWAAAVYGPRERHSEEEAQPSMHPTRAAHERWIPTNLAPARGRGRAASVMALSLALALTLLGADAAHAHSLNGPTYSPGARATVPMTIGASGSADPTAALRVYVQQGGACPTSANVEAGTIPAGLTEVIARSSRSGAFSYSGTYTPPVAGSYSICAFLFGGSANTGTSAIVDELRRRARTAAAAASSAAGDDRPRRPVRPVPGTRPRDPDARPGQEALRRADAEGAHVPRRAPAHPAGGLQRGERLPARPAHEPRGAGPRAACCGSSCSTPSRAACARPEPA